MIRTLQEARDLFIDNPDKIKWDIETTHDMYLTRYISFMVPRIKLNTDLSYTVEKIDEWHGCRGYFIEMFYASIRGRKYEYRETKHDVTNLHLGPTIFLIKGISKDRAIKAMSLINELEEKAGWERSFCKRIKKGKDDWIFCGINEWKKFWPLMSFLLAVIRETHNKQETKKLDQLIGMPSGYGVTLDKTVKLMSSINEALPVNYFEKVKNSLEENEIEQRMLHSSGITEFIKAAAGEYDYYPNIHLDIPTKISKVLDIKHQPRY